MWVAGDLEVVIVVRKFEAARVVHAADSGLVFCFGRIVLGLDPFRPDFVVPGSERSGRLDQIVRKADDPWSSWIYFCFGGGGLPQAGTYLLYFSRSAICFRGDHGGPETMSQGSRLA